MTFEVYTKLAYTETTKTYHVDDTLTTLQTCRLYKRKCL